MTVQHASSHRTHEAGRHELTNVQGARAHMHLATLVVPAVTWLSENGDVDAASVTGTDARREPGSALTAACRGTAGCRGDRGSCLGLARALTALSPARAPIVTGGSLCKTQTHVTGETHSALVSACAARHAFVSPAVHVPCAVPRCGSSTVVLRQGNTRWFERYRAAGKD